MIPSFQTTFSVTLSCGSCVEAVKTALTKVQGIETVEADVGQQCVLVTGSASPSSIIAAIQKTGRDAILRGSGKANSAAVCILETHSSMVTDKVRGLVRMVQVSDAQTVFDVGIRGVSPGIYYASIRMAGDISQGPESTGGIWDAESATSERRPARGKLGTIEIGSKGTGSLFLNKNMEIWELIGRGIVVSKIREGVLSQLDADTLVGVIARSAGVWDNDKVVCACTGKTVWEERRDQVARGML